MPRSLICRFCPVRKREASTSDHLLQQLETGDVIRNDFFNGQLASYGQIREGVAGAPQAVKHATGCSGNVCHAAMMDKFNGPRMSDNIDSDKSAVLEEARGFLTQYYAEFSTGDDKSRATGARSRAPSRVSGRSRNRPTGTLEARFREVKREIARTGTYMQTFAELEFGAQLAWRNEGRCINRKVWDTLRLLDRREEEEPKKLFEYMLEHIDSVWTDGTLVVRISVFKPKTPGQRGCEFVSTQLHRYAAYPVQGGGFIGDPANHGLTELCVQCGWEPPPPSKRTQWDFLPVLIQDSGGAVHMFELPERLKIEPFVVHLTHPNARVAEAIEVLGLRWCAIPIINNFCLWAGGIAYQCAPFSGWFMETEIARDLADVQRYNILPRLMDELKLPESVHSLALDDAWLSLNQSVLYSFQQKRITIVDHQSTSRGFCSWFAETSRNTIIPGDWVWIVPPLGGSTCPVFHQEMLNFRLSPAYILNEDRVAECLQRKTGGGLGVPLPQAQAALRGSNLVEQRKIPHIQVLFGSQTGTVERLASEYVRKMTRLGAKCSCLSLDAWLDDSEVVAGVLADLPQLLSFPAPMEGNEDNVGTDEDRIFAVQALYSKLQEAAALKTLIVIMCSTTGTGHMPSNASGFAQACADLRHLAKSSDILQQKVSELRAMGNSYAVCGFGSTSYLKFNQAARDVQASLQDLLGSPAVALGLCDAAGEQKKTWAAWQKTLSEAAFPVAPDRSGPRACPIPSTMVEWHGHSAQGHEVTLQVPTSPTCSPMSPASHGTSGSAAMCVTRTRTQMSSETGHIRPSEQHHSPDDVGGLVTATRELLRGSEIARMAEVTFVLSGHRRYTPGDVLEVAPACTADVASRFIAALGLQGKKDSNLMCRPRDSDQEERASSVPWRFAKEVTLWNAVRYELDISCAPPQGLLVYIAWATGSEKLRQLAEDESAYSAWVEDEKPSLLELIQEHSITCTPGAPKFVPLEAFLEELPRPKRRLYSISCTMPPSSNKTKLSVTCSLHRFGPSGQRMGLCSSYLHSLRPGDKVRARIRHGERLDLEGATRVLLIGAGSGVSPLRAHWQKLVNSAGQCQVVLYQGCQTTAEQAYAEEVKKLVAEGKMEAHVAFSRAEPGQYVQDVLRRTKDLWRLLQDPGTRVYVSGATRVAKAVRHTFEGAGEAAGVPLQEARQYLLSLAKERRYVEDAFGGE